MIRTTYLNAATYDTRPGPGERRQGQRARPSYSRCAACGARAMADGAEDDDKVVREARQLPLPERLAHAHWRVRADAYGDVGKEAGAARDATSPTLAEFGAPGRSSPACSRV